MKKVTITLMFLLIVASCKKEVIKDYVTLSGSITNQNSDSLMVFSRTYKKIIKVNKDGTFSDTLKVDSGNYIFSDGKRGGQLYLKKGYELNLTADAKEFNETILYEGKGSEANNYLAKKALLSIRLLDFEKLMSLDKNSFKEKLNIINNEYKSLLKTTKSLDSTFFANEEKEIEEMSKRFTNSFGERQVLLAMKGQVSPKFINYENYAGGTMSLDDLIGKYVYIDLWATWCIPCIREVPYLKEVEKMYHDKNIKFVSVSVDKQKDYDAWRKMVEEKELTGIQLYAKEDKTFIDAYKINGIPRFILVDPEGNIVSADAPKPSSDGLLKLFNELKI